MLNASTQWNGAAHRINASINVASSRIVLDYTSLALWFTVTIMICIVGTVLAGSLIVAFLVHKNLLRGTNVLIGYLLCLDLLNAAVVNPVTFVILLLSQLGWQFNADRICQVFIFLTMFLNCVATWTSAFIAMNRFVAMFLPNRYEVWIKTKILVSVIVISCILGLIVAVPPLFGISAFFGRFFPMGNCAMAPKEGPLANVYIAIGSTIPTVMQGILYFLMAVQMACGRKLCKHGKLTAPNTRDNIPQRRRRNIGRMLIVSYVWYLICFIPVPIILTYFPAMFQIPSVFIWLKTVQLSGYAGTPFIFILLSEDYREAVRELFCRRGQIQPWSLQMQSGPEIPINAVRTAETKQNRFTSA